MKDNKSSFPPSTSWLFMEMIMELGDVELARKASAIAAKWVLKELDDHFQGFASNDRVVAWERILSEIPRYGIKKDD